MLVEDSCAAEAEGSQWPEGPVWHGFPATAARGASLCSCPEFRILVGLTQAMLPGLSAADHSCACKVQSYGSAASSGTL